MPRKSKLLYNDFIMKKIYMVQFQLVTLCTLRRNMGIVLDLLKYNKHNWVICVDLKMVNFLLSQQGGYTKYLYFLCYGIAEWGTSKGQETKKIWPSMTVGENML